MVSVKLPSSVVSTVPDPPAGGLKAGLGEEAEPGLAAGVDDGGSAMGSSETLAKRAGWFVSAQKTWPVTLPVCSGVVALWVWAVAAVASKSAVTQRP